MKYIKDIRLFESAVPNVDGNALPDHLGTLYAYDAMACLDVIQRLLFLLRHRGFGFEGFDHLYLNFTPCIAHGELREANRYTPREFAWYRYVDAGCAPAQFNRWTIKEKSAFVLNMVRKALYLKAPDDQKQLVSQAFDDVLQGGAQLLVPYKRKETANGTAEILVRITDDLDFISVVRVIETDGRVRMEQELPPCGRDAFISQIGTITLGKSFLRIVPRKNWHAEYYDLKPLRIEWK